jgi:hypothetical protein
MVVLEKTIKETYLTDVSIPNNHNLHITIIEKLQKYTNLKEQFIIIWQLKRAYIVQLVLSTTDIIPNLSHESLKLLNLRAALYITMKTAVIINICRRVRKFLAEQ